MPPPLTQPIQGAPTAGPGDALQQPAPRRAVLVVNDPVRRRRLLEMMGALAPDCQVEVVAGVLDGMARSTSMPAHLLVLDASVDRPVMPSLVRYLGRTAPAATVHVFDNLAGQTVQDSLDNSEEFDRDEREALGNESAFALLRAAIERWLGTATTPSGSVHSIESKQESK